MKNWIKQLVWILASLIAAAAVGWGAWFVSNTIDANAKPWPEALTVAPSKLDRASNLFAALQEAPMGKGELRVRLDDCPDGNCAESWPKQAPDVLASWAEQREQHRAFGAVCESWTSRRPLSYEEPLPANWSPTSIPEFQRTIRCSGWLLGLALATSQAGNAREALAKLEQAQALDHAVLLGSNSLVGHMIALSMVERRLQATLLVASQHPSLAADLAAQLQGHDGLAAPEIAAAQRRWIAYEANSNRGAIQYLMQPGACEKAHQATQGQTGPIWLCKLQHRVAMPEYSAQMFASHWLEVLAQIDERNPLAAVEGIQSIVGRAPSGWFGSYWHWRGTIPHILFEVAPPGYKDYFERSADTYLASESTRLWLLAQAERVPGEGRAAWLAARLQGHPLATRLNAQTDGSWLLKRLSSRPDSRLTRWHAPA